MNEEIVIPGEATIVPKEDGNVAVTAFEPNDMPRCQTALKAWAHNKVKTLDSDVTELEQALAEAKKRKWKTSVFARHLSSARKRMEFYRKIMLALDAGYVIVPNFPVQAFAIRTDKPIKGTMQLVTWGRHDFQQTAPCLPVDEGEYQNPFPVVRHRQVMHEGKEKQQQWPSDWDELDFPISMAKGEILEATSRAMALKIFDDMGILPKARKEDPIIVGQVHLRGAYGSYDKTVTFMVAWHLDTRVL